MRIAENNLHVKIPINSIVPEKKVSFGVYKKDKERFEMIVEAGTVFPKGLSSLLHHSLEEKSSLYIHNENKSDYYLYLESLLGDISSNPNIPLKEKSKFIYDTSSRVVNELFEKPESKETIERTKTLVDNTISIILSDDKSIKSMMAIGSHDYYTYTHSVDVAVFAIGFANYLKFSHKDISNIGYAAMMHDIGKSKIPSEIINKKGKLSIEEFEIMKTHPIHSYEILQYHDEKNSDILLPTRHHHEKARGDGYPDKITIKKTHEFAKIIAISDIFSALTTQRSYKDAFTSFDALSLMKSKMIEDLDKNLFVEFIKFMSKNSH